MYTKQKSQQDILLERITAFVKSFKQLYPGAYLDNFNDMAKTWCKELCNLNIAQFNYGREEALGLGLQSPVSLPKFKSLCLEYEKPYDPNIALPYRKGPMSVEDKAHGAEQCRKMREIIADVAAKKSLVNNI